jgi:hypothetical protein
MGDENENLYYETQRQINKRHKDNYKTFVGESGGAGPLE